MSGFDTTIWRRAARTQKRRIEHIGTVRRRDQDDALIASKPSISTRSWFKVLLALVIAGPEPGATMPADASISSMK